MKKVFIIAEAGVNHNGNISIAKKLIDIAVDAEADAVKFQTFKAARVITKTAPKAEYQKQTTSAGESQLDMARRLELNQGDFRELYDYCRHKGIMFLSTPFDLESIDFLVGLGLKIFKIPSGEITNLPYLRKIGGLRKKVIMSTGMAELKEVENALGTLINAGTKKKDITVLHCTTAYPAPPDDVNLLAMATIRNAFNVAVGYSDHTFGIEVPIAAAALGARVIEKHFTLDKNMEGPDHRTSLNPEELKAMVTGIRKVEKALGSGAKKVSFSEQQNRLIARKSIVAARDIKKGEVFTPDNVTTKRPGTGISPMEWNNVIGQKAKTYFKEDTIIEL